MTTPRMGMPPDNSLLHTSPFRAPCADARGSILIITLWWLVILSAMAVALYLAVRPRVNLAIRLQDRAQTHFAAVAMLNLCRAIIAEDETPGFDALDEPWSSNPSMFQGVELGAARFSVGRPATGGQVTDEPVLIYGLADEEARVSLNRAPQRVLQQLLVVCGEKSESEAEDIAANIIDWRDEDDKALVGGAEDTYYRALFPPYACKNAKFESVEEVRLVKGVDEQLFARIRDYLTVHGNGRINLNTAEAPVLLAVGLGEALVQRILRYRTGYDGIPGTADDNHFERTGDVLKVLEDWGILTREEKTEIQRALNAGFLTVRSDNFTAHVFRELDKLPQGMQITFVFNRNGAILYWREG